MRFSESARALEALENTVSRLQMYELLDGLDSTMKCNFEIGDERASCGSLSVLS